MRKVLKKSLTFFLALVIMLTAITTCLMAFGEDSVAINSINFPDTNFRGIVAEMYDDDGDGVLSADERSITSMSLSGIYDADETPIKNLKGIEFFTNIKILRIGGIGLEELDVSALTGLTNLTCQGNKLTSLDISHNGNLVFLNCSDNNISEIEYGYNPNLKTFYCYANSITSLEFSQMINVEDLRCDQNELTSLDVSWLRNLTELNCSQNHIPQLELGQTALTKVTDYMVGGQVIDLQANVQDGVIYIPFTEHKLTVDNYAGCSLDNYDDGACFEFNQFVAYDVDEIKDGIDYACSTGIEGAENMTVHINVQRDFYQVSFYTDESCTEKFARSIVYPGESGVAPEITTTPMCKAFDAWSDDFSVVNEDMSVYPLWADAHTYELTDFDCVDTGTVVCSQCGDSFTVSFKLATKANDENYTPYLDVHPDGHINVKDFVILKNTYKK